MRTYISKVSLILDYIVNLYFSGVRVIRSLDLCVCFVDCCFYFWPLCCLFLFDIRILITPLITSNSSCQHIFYKHVLKQQIIYIVEFFWGLDHSYYSKDRNAGVDNRYTYTNLFVVVTDAAILSLQYLTDFVCLYNYEFLLSLCKIARSSVILLLPLFTINDRNRLYLQS